MSKEGSLNVILILFQVNQNVNQPGIFAGIKIDTDSLVKRLPDCDAHSVTSATY